MVDRLRLVTRGTKNLSVFNSPLLSSDATVLDDSYAKTMQFSEDGRLLVWISATEGICVYNLDEGRIVTRLPLPKVQGFAISPLGTYIVTLENFNATECPLNMKLFSIQGEQFGSIVQSWELRKPICWRLQWSSDEKLAARIFNSEILFYEDGDYATVTRRLQNQKISDFSLSPTKKEPHYVAIYVPSKQAQPAFVRVFTYPLFGITASLANKSFFKCDKIHWYWSPKANALIFMTYCDVSENSYYGEQTLYFVSMKTCEAMRITVGDNPQTPVYNVAWSPTGDRFCAVYGFMPARATMFDLKAEPVMDFGTGARNVAIFNPHGNILCLAGFGGLHGNIEFWDTAKRTQLSKHRAGDATHLDWAPDGEHLILSTCAPKLRVNNGFKVVDYRGTVKFEVLAPEKTELYEVAWRPVPVESFPAPIPTAGIVDPSNATQEKKAYVPPSMRNRGGVDTRIKLHVDEAPSSIGVGGVLLDKQPESAPVSKTAQKNKKKNDARKARENGEEGAASSPFQRQPAATASSSPPSAPAAGRDANKEKRIRNLTQKLCDIQKLKERVEAGDKVEANQLTKIQNEAQVIAELQQLRM